MKIERRITGQSDHPVTLQKRAEGESPVISGYGAMFYDGTPESEYELWSFGNERCVERMLPTAFDNAISRPDDVRGLFNHDPNLILGRTKSQTMSLSVDKQGLVYTIDPGDTTISRDVQAHLSRGDVSGSSIAFVVDEERWTISTDADGNTTSLREILSVTLYDTGPVVYPAYEATTCGLRAEGKVDEAKRSLELYREKLAAETKPADVKPAVDVRARFVALTESGLK